MYGMEIEMQEMNGTYRNNQNSGLPLYMKISVMVLVCSLNIGHAYCSNIVSALQGSIMVNMKISYFEYGSLNSISSAPNVFFIVISGYITDYTLGIRKATIFFTLLVMLGQIVFTVSAYIQNYQVMIIGRLIYGIGSESVFLCSSRYIALWYKNSTLAFVYSIQAGIIKASQTMGFTLSHAIYESMLTLFPKKNSTIALCIAFTPGIAATLMSLIFAICLAIIDYREREDVLIEKNKFIQAIKRITGFPIIFWMNCLFCILFFGAFHAFSYFSMDMLEKKTGLDPKSSNTIISIGMVAGIMAAPIFGIFSLYIGLDLLVLISSSSLITIFHISLAYRKLPPLVTRILSSIASVGVSCIVWPIIPLVIDASDLTIAISIMMCFQQVGVFSSPLIAGVIIDHYGYFSFQIFVSIMCAVSATTASFMIYIDKKARGGNLNKSKLKCT